MKLDRTSSNYWREIYKTEWHNGSLRVKIIKEMIQGIFPLKDLKIEEGFMGESNQEILIGNPVTHQKGEPDFYVKHRGKTLFNVEITGSFVNIKDSEMWIRPDKVQWAKEHPEPRTWAFFVYKDKILRFCVNEADDYPIEQRTPNGVIERFHIIPQNDAFEFVNLNWWKNQ